MTYTCGMNLNDYVTREEASGMRKVSVRTIDRWLKAGLLPHVRYHRLILIRKQDVTNSMKLRRVQK